MPQTFKLALPTLAGGLLLALAACQPASTPEEATTPAPTAASEAASTPVTGPAPLGVPALWRVADEDTVLHLFGTVHILRPETEWRSEAFEGVFEAADAVYFEADVLSDEAQLQMAALLPQLGVFNDGTRLSDLLEPEEAREVREALEIVGVPQAAIEPLKPWLATVQLSVLALQQQGYEPDSGVESVLTADALEAGKELRFLETGEQQLRFFADMPLEDQVDFLVASAEQIEDDPELLDRLVAEWAEGDVTAIGTIMAEPDAMGSELVYDVLIVERNANWTRAIETLMAEEAGTFLMAVGAGHLAGEDSVVEMLRARGYEVTGP